MKHKNFLLITFFLTLFVFQQVQAGATMPPKENLSQVSFAPAYAPLPTINVFVLALREDNNAIDYSINGDKPYKCLYAYQYYGCGIIDPEQPTAARNPVPISVDPYYLRDVIAIEMNVGQIPPTLRELPALKAQAIAARTVADWKFINQPQDEDFGTGVIGINNSTQYQVFIPGSYNNFPSAQSLIDRAITETQGQFLSYESDGTYPDGTRKTIDAEFSSDIIPESKYGNQGYLQIIQEPISSSTCIVQGTAGNDWGMSQRGAIRWAIGNTCPDESGTDWLVQWTDYRQILVHYYTGIDILNASDDKVAPDNRWNLLNFNNNQPLSVNSGQISDVEIQLQNTSTSNWATNDIIAGYQWTERGGQAVSGNWTDAAFLPATDKGNPPAIVTLSILAPATGGEKTLHLDVRYENYPNGWFSNSDWPDARIDLYVNGPTPEPPVTVSGSITDGSNDGGTNPTPCEFSLEDNEVYLGGCIDGGDLTSGFRFENMQIPRNANIESAYVRFTVDGEYTNIIHTRIHGEASGSPLLFSEASPPTNRLITFNSTVWDITQIWNLGEQYNTPDLSAVIQEIINRPDWNSGQPIALIFKNAGSGTEHRRVLGFERTESEPGYESAQLVVTYNTNPTPTPTALPPNVTPQPTATSIPIQPTYTHLPATQPPTTQPTASPCLCVINHICILPNARASSSFAFVNPTGTISAPSSLRSTQNQEPTDPVVREMLIYRIRDEIMNVSPEGQRLTVLYYEHSMEIASLMLSDPNLYAQGFEALDAFLPGLQALADGQGDEVAITVEQVETARAFLDELMTRGSAELRQDIQAELERHPFEAMVGMNMVAAWSHVNGYSLEWLPPISNSNPYRANQGSAIPVKFAVTDFEGNFVIDNSVILKVLDSNGNTVIGPIQAGDNPNSAIKIQGNQYHHNLKTKNLPNGFYTLQIFYNSIDPNAPATWQVQIK
jgi:hypothetical protein